MAWEIVLLPEAEEDLAHLDRSVRVRVAKAIKKTSGNPLPKSEGGYGNPLRNQGGCNLAGLLKIRLKADGIRVVYKLERDGDVMRVVVVGARAGKEVYREAARRRQSHGL